MTFSPIFKNIQWVCLSIASFPICENGWFGHNFVQCINFYNKRAYNALYKCLSFKWETRTKHFELRVFILNITIWNMLTNSFVLNNVYSKLVDLYDTNWWPLSKFGNREKWSVNGRSITCTSLEVKAIHIDSEEGSSPEWNEGLIYHT